MRNVYLSRIPIYKAESYFSEYSEKRFRKFLITFESKTEARNIFRRKNPHFSSSAKKTNKKFNMKTLIT